MTEFRYRRGRWITRVVAQDALLVLAAAMCAHTGGALGAVLGGAIVVTMLWGIVTLHYPSAVELTDDAIAFRAYGRAHVFSWRDVARVRIRRFVVRDRVFVRLVGRAGASPWRGRYWLTDGLDGFDALVEELARRAQ